MPEVRSVQLRPITAQEWPAFLEQVSGAFGATPSGPFVDTPPPLLELDRSLAGWDDDRIVATAGAFSRTLSVPGAVVPCAAVSFVTVAPTHRRRGVLTAMMRRQLDDIRTAEREPVAALWASEPTIYGRFGYAPATVRAPLSGPLARLRLRRDVDLGTGRVVAVPRAEYQAAAAAVHDRVRRAVPGNFDRDSRWWDDRLLDLPDRRQGATALRYLLHTETDGTVTGYAAYRTSGGWTDTGHPDGTLSVEEVRAASTPAYAALWQLLLSVDLVSTVRLPRASPDDPIRHLLTDARALTGPVRDGLWVRVVDVGRALSARRYPAPLDLVFEVHDEFCPENTDRWHLWGHPAGAFCDRTDSDPDVVLGIEELSAAYLGGVSLASLQAAGRVVEVSPGAVVQASTGFGWPVTPWCPDDF